MRRVVYLEAVFALLALAGPRSSSSLNASGPVLKGLVKPGPVMCKTNQRVCVGGGGTLRGEKPEDLS